MIRCRQGYPPGRQRAQQIGEIITLLAQDRVDTGRKRIRGQVLDAQVQLDPVEQKPLLRQRHMPGQVFKRRRCPQGRKQPRLEP